MRRLYPAIIVFAILISAYLLFNSYDSQPALTPIDKLVYKEDLELNVNGERITAKDVETQYEKIPDEIKGNLTKDKLLESMITQKLLLQEAGRNGITVDDEDVEKYLEQVRAFTDLNESALEEQISRSGYTLEEYRKDTKEVLEVSKLLDQELNLKNVQASDAEVESFIQENKGEFQDILDAGKPELETVIKNRVKMKLTGKKQQGLVDNYLRSLRQKARIEGGGGV